MVVCAATRVHGIVPSPALEAKLESFIQNSLKHTSYVLIAVKVDLSSGSKGLELLNCVNNIVCQYSDTVRAVPVAAWSTGVTPALNALLQCALSLQMTHILYQSFLPSMSRA